MSGTTLRIVLAGVLFFHGIGQIMGVIPALQLSVLEGKDSGWMQNWSSQSWALNPLLGDAAARVICIVLFTLSFIGFAGAALALMGWKVPHDMWRSMALVSAALSMVAIIFYWNALILLFPHKIGNIAVNTAVLVSLLAVNWPAESDLGF
jgi:hypothetical protein